MIVPYVESRVKSMEVTHVKSKKVFTDIKELGFYKEGFRVVVALGREMLAGPSLGED